MPTSPDLSPPPLPDPGPESEITTAGAELAVAEHQEAPTAEGAGRTTVGQWLPGAIVLALLVLLGVKYGPWGLAIVGGIVAIIFLHELGHYVMAKRAGMKVTEFFLGFGPRIWSFRRGETEYGLKAIPAGAYVKIIGMHNLEEVDPADEARSYRQAPFWPRIGVAVAGSAMHFMLALLLIFVILVGFGGPGGHLFTNPDPTSWTVGSVTKGSAAADAGIRKGDRILAVGNTRTATFEDLKGVIEDNPKASVPITVERNGKTVVLPATIGQRCNAQGQPVDQGFLGVGEGYARERVGVLAAVPQTFVEFGKISALSVQSLGGFFTPSGVTDYGKQVVNANADRQQVQKEQKEPDPDCLAQAASSNAGEHRLVSLVGVFNLSRSAAAQDGVEALLAIFVLLNVFLGIFNMVPLLPFDGGHVAIAVYERVQEKRLHRRRYFTDVSRLLPLTYLVVLVLVGIFVTSLYLDIANPISLN